MYIIANGYTSRHKTTLQTVFKVPEISGCLINKQYMVNVTEHSRFVTSLQFEQNIAEMTDFEKSMIFLRGSRVGEHASARARNHFPRGDTPASRRRASRLLVGGDFCARSRALPLDYP